MENNEQLYASRTLTPESFLILVSTRDEDGMFEPWRDSGEGPFYSYQSAVRFAESEVGVAFMIVQICGKRS